MKPFSYAGVIVALSMLLVACGGEVESDSDTMMEADASEPDLGSDMDAVQADMAEPEPDAEQEEESCAGRTCSSHGVCFLDKCECSPRYAGEICDTCAPGYTNYPDCDPEAEAPQPFEAPPLQAPMENAVLYADQSYTFAWGALEGATSYRLRVSTDVDSFHQDTGCPECLFNDTTALTEERLDVSAWPRDNEVIYWSVRAGDPEAGRSGEWANLRRMLVQDPVEQGCHIEASPPLGQWTQGNPTTPEFADCTCADGESCHAIYKGRVVALEGNRATLEFAKADDSGPSVDVSYWIGVNESASAVCDEVPAYVARDQGLWPSGQVLQVQDVPVWPEGVAGETFEDASTGAVKKLFVISGGSGMPEQRVWFQDQQITFTKVCP
jgi:hypothetical protein